MPRKNNKKYKYNKLIKTTPDNADVCVICLTSTTDDLVKSNRTLFDVSYGSTAAPGTVAATVAATVAEPPVRLRKIHSDRLWRFFGFTKEKRCKKYYTQTCKCNVWIHRGCMEMWMNTKLLCPICMDPLYSTTYYNYYISKYLEPTFHIMLLIWLGKICLRL